MKFLAWLTEFFFSVFGITRPKPEQVRAANLVIGGLLLAALVVVGALVFMILAF